VQGMSSRESLNFGVGSPDPFKATGQDMDLESIEMEKKIGLGVDFFIHFLGL